MESSRPQNERVLFILWAGKKRAGKRVGNECESMCMCVSVCECVCVCDGKKQRPPTVSALPLAAPPAHSCVQGPVFVCGAGVYPLWQSGVWLQDNWHLAKKGDSSLRGKKMLRASTKNDENET